MSLQKETRTNYLSLITTLGAAIGTLAFTGCERQTYNTGDNVAPDSRPYTTVDNDLSVEPAPLANVDVDRGEIVERTGTPVVVTVDGPERVRVGEQARMVFNLTNTTGQPLYGVKIVSQDDSIRIAGPGNQADPENNGVVNAGILQAGETRAISAFVTGESEGVLTRCFAVEYDIGFCAEIAVVKPDLKFTRFFVDEDGDMYDSDYLCERLYAIYRVENVGSGSSRPITVSEKFTGGVKFNNKNRLKEDVGVLEPGDVWEETYLLDIDKPTAYSGVAFAETSASRLQSDVDSFDVGEAQIALTLDGPSEHKMFRTAQYQVTVRNVGNIIARDIDLDIDTSSFLDADVQYNTQLIGDEIGEFDIDMLAPGESRTINFLTDFTSVGEYSLVATADGYCVADPQKAVLATNVTGVPALRIEMIDTVDPVIVGEETSYRIRVKNQGTAQDTSINLNVTLPSNLEFVSGEGSTAVTNRGNTVNLGRVNSIEPEEIVEWIVVARAQSAGAVQTRVSLRSKAIAAPVVEAEPTNIVRP